jgi:hypothetical protein
LLCAKAAQDASQSDSLRHPPARATIASAFRTQIRRLIDQKSAAQCSASAPRLLLRFP